MENLELLIKELVKQPKETAWLEFKLNNDEHHMIGQDICALANAAALAGRDKAYFIWGVEDGTHELKGTSFNWETAKVGNEELENWLRHSLSANANFEFDSVRFDEKWFGVLEITAAIGSTVMFKKEEFIRIGSYTKKLNDYPAVKTELWSRLRYRNFETQAAKADLELSQALDMIDYPAYFSLLKKSIPEGHENIAHDLLEDELLKKQDNGLYTITNLGAVLFARRISEFPTVSRKAIRVVQFEGKSKIELLKEYTGQKGYAVGFEGLMEFLKALLPSKEVISGAVRSTKESYPEIALRETIANALIHQDFSISGTGPVVEVYADRIEICNPGAPLVNIERIIDTPPKSRNEKLASMMRRLRMCEELGTGWDKIVATCELMQLPAPRIQVFQENTKAVLFSSVPYKMLSQADRLYACYCHASIMYLRREPMTNSTLRDRFGIEKKNSAMVSRLLKDAMAKNLIRPVDPEAAPKNQRYVPFWA